MAYRLLLVIKMLFRNFEEESKENLSVREIYVKSILSKSGIYSIDYSINPYLGCQHGCVYCYARFMKRYAKTDRAWGKFVFIKVNAAKVLTKEIKKIPHGRSILLSSVCDPYQPLEEKYKITQSILEILLKNDFHKVYILTKSSLVKRDIDIIKGFRDIEVGFSLTHLSNKVQQIFEPNASTPEARIETLNTLSKNNIATYLFVAPVLPKITDRYIDKILGVAKKGKVRYIFFDTLNLKAGNWRTIVNALREYDVNLEREYKQILFNKENYDKYFSNFKKQTTQICEDLELNCTFTF